MARQQTKKESLTKKFDEIVEASKQEENIELGVRTRRQAKQKLAQKNQKGRS
jgi:hypothetical protein